jgi:hypothetical protein
MLTFEHDPNFGSRIGGESELDAKWLKMARELADDEPELQKERIDQLRKLLGEKEMIILPGEDWQMLMLLRAANSIPDEAAKVAKVFLEYRQKIFSSKCFIALSISGHVNLPTLPNSRASLAV